MKNIFKAFAALVMGTVLMVSCQKAGEPLAQSISVNQNSVTIDGQNATPVKVKVAANGDWIAVVPSWIEMTPSSGSGNTEVSITAGDNVDEYNYLAGPRSGVVYFYGDDPDAPFALQVDQVGEKALDTKKTYVKVSSANEFDPTKQFLLVAQLENEYQLALGMSVVPDGGRYDYLYGEKVTVEDGKTINMPNGSKAFSWTSVANGEYAIAQAGGGYIYQSGSYNTSFYLSADPSKETWTVTFGNDGYPEIKSKVSGRFMQWQNGKYSEFVTGDGLLEGNDRVLIFQDQAAASDETLTVPETVFAGADATTVSFEVKSNKKWSVRKYDSWIKSVTTSGEGNGTIEVTFDVNTDTKARTATLKVVGETTSYDVILTQDKVRTTVAELRELITGTNSARSSYAVDFTTNNPVVSYVNGSNAYIEDATGAILLYLRDHGLKAGDKISGKVSGQGYVYNGLKEIVSMDGRTVTAGGTIPLTVITIKDLLANFEANMSRRVKIENVEVKSAFVSRNGKIAQGTDEIAVRAEISNGLTLTEGAKGDIICYPSQYNSEKRLSFWQNADFIAK